MCKIKCNVLCEEKSLYTYMDSPDDLWERMVELSEMILKNSFLSVAQKQ